jgi:hypothetical protein
MCRPRWIATLLLALAIAGAFAALGQWQLSRAVSNGEVLNPLSETVRPLQDVATPQSPVFESQAGQRTETTGHFVASGYDVLSDRLDDGTPGYWVIGQFAVNEPADTYLAVALGWTAELEEARAAAIALGVGASGTTETLEGRYLPTEGPTLTDAQREAGSDPTGDSSIRAIDTTMSVAALINRWPEFGASADVYGGYLVTDAAPAGLTAIDSPEPDRSVQVNWLNIFYAAEWVVFAGFAVYLWYRLTRDAWEREVDEAAEEAAQAAAEGSATDDARQRG